MAQAYVSSSRFLSTTKEIANLKINIYICDKNVRLECCVCSKISSKKERKTFFTHLLVSVTFLRVSIFPAIKKQEETDKIS